MPIKFSTTVITKKQEEIQRIKEELRHEQGDLLAAVFHRAKGMSELQKIPAVYMANYERAMRGHSRTAAIKAKCLECMNFKRVQIKNCSVFDCPLHPYRPYSAQNTPKKVGGLTPNAAPRVAQVG